MSYIESGGIGGDSDGRDGQAFFEVRRAGAGDAALNFWCSDGR